MAKMTEIVVVTDTVTGEIIAAMLGGGILPDGYKGTVVNLRNEYGDVAETDEDGNISFA